MEKIKVFVRNVYGKNLIYPECDRAKIFTKLVKKRTLDSYNLHLIHALGFEIEITNVPEEKWKYFNKICWDIKKVDEFLNVEWR